MLTVTSRHGRELFAVSWPHVGLAATQLGSVLVMAAVATLSAPLQQAWPAPFVLALSALAMAAPDSEAGLLSLVAFGGWWLGADASAPWWGVLIVAALGLIFHLSLAAAASVPSGAVIRATAVRALAGDAVRVVLITVAAVAVVEPLQGSHVQGATILMAVAFLLIALVPWIASITRH